MLNAADCCLSLKCLVTETTHVWDLLIEKGSCVQHSGLQLQARATQWLATAGPCNKLVATAGPCNKLVATTGP